jgi:hypothetical protein
MDNPSAGASISNTFLIPADARQDLSVDDEINGA